MATIVSALRTVILVPLFFVFTLLAAVSVVIVEKLRGDSPAVDWIIDLWSRLFLGIAPVRFRVEGAEHLDPERRYVVVANHLSNFDIPLLFVVLRPIRIRFLAKKEIYKIPLVAQAMDAVGIVKIDRQAAMTAHEAINAGVVAATERGFSLMVFAEGTRSRDGEMHDFRKGAFRMAIDNELPLLPVVIHGTWSVNPPGQWLIRPGAATVVVLEPIETGGLTYRADGLRIHGEVRDAMQSRYEALRRPGNGH